MSFRREVRHDGIRRVRIVEGSDPHSAWQKAATQAEAWAALWDRMRSADGEPGAGIPDTRTDVPPSSPEEGHRIAAELTSRARRELEALGEILAAEAPSPPPARVDLEPFPEPPPESPPLPDPKPRPSRSDPRFKAHLTLLDHVLPSRRKRAESEASERFQAAWSQWHKAEKEVTEALAAYHAEFEAWDQRRLEFEADQRRRRKAAKERMEALSRGDPEALEAHLSGALAQIVLPVTFPRSFDLRFDGGSGLLNLDLQLPSPEDLPTLESVSFRESRSDYMEEHLSEREEHAAYDSVIHQYVLRVIRDLFQADDGERLRAIGLNGRVHATDRSTGQVRQLSIVALEVSREIWAALNLARVSPVACFKALGGVSAGAPHELRPVPPIREPARDTGSRRSRRSGPSGTGENGARPLELDDLSSPEVHRRLVEVLHDQFVPPGGDLQLTVVREDGSMEALIHGPKPGGAGTVIVHVHASTRPIGEGEVRGLLRRMAKEHAGGGVLLTTGEISPPAWQYARGQGEAVALFDGVAVQAFARGQGPGRGEVAQGPSEGLEFPGLTTPQ